MGVDIGLLGSTTDLYRYGMTSLLGMQIAAALSDEFGISLSSKDVMQSATIEELEKGISKGKSPGANEALSGVRDPFYPLSGSQMGIYAEYDKAPDATNYNIPSLYDLGYGIEPERLKNALITVVNAHPYLKSVIVREGGDVFLKRGGCEEVVVHSYKLEKGFEDYSSIREEEMVNGSRSCARLIWKEGRFTGWKFTRAKAGGSGCLRISTILFLTGFPMLFF